MTRAEENEREREREKEGELEKARANLAATLSSQRQNSLTFTEKLIQKERLPK